MGGSKSPSCDWVTKQIWDYCVKHNICLSAMHLPGCENTIAGTESRHFDHTKRMLDPDVYGSVVSEFGTPTIDLFAFQLNKQCPVYASWQPDHDATFVDAFSANRKKFFFYAFPPFSLIGRCLEKIQTNRAEGVLVVRYLTSQSWYSKLLQMLVNHPLLISHRERLLTLSECNQLHLLWEKAE